MPGQYCKLSLPFKLPLILKQCGISTCYMWGKKKERQNKNFAPSNFDVLYRIEIVSEEVSTLIGRTGYIVSTDQCKRKIWGPPVKKL